MNQTTSQDATQATFDSLGASLDLMARLTRHIAAQRDGLRAGARADWGHAGSAAATMKALREITDQAFSEGEYAHVACLACGGSYAAASDATGDHAAHRAYEQARLAIEAR